MTLEDVSIEDSSYKTPKSYWWYKPSDNCMFNGALPSEHKDKGKRDRGGSEELTFSERKKRKKCG